MGVKREDEPRLLARRWGGKLMREEDGSIAVRIPFAENLLDREQVRSNVLWRLEESPPLHYKATLISYGSGVAFVGLTPAWEADDEMLHNGLAKMRVKLDKKRGEGRGGWEHTDPGLLRNMLYEHVHKGDPVDVAILALMLLERNEHCRPGE